MLVCWEAESFTVGIYRENEICFFFDCMDVTIFMTSGDMELKQNKALPAERQIVTADPDITMVFMT